MDRKEFLKIAVAGGLGTLFGGVAFVPGRWHENGISLTTAKRQSLVMGSVISIEVIAETKKDGYEAIRRAVRGFHSFDKKFSMYDQESEMGKLAKKAGQKSISVSKEAQYLLQYAKNMHQSTGGLFDITIEPAMKQWGFRKNPSAAITPPTAEELQKLERLIGSEHILLEDGRSLLQKPGMALDTGGIAGGFALDKAVQAMKECNVAAGFINFSGDIHCFGRPLDDKKWPVYLLDPQTLQPLANPVYLADEALSTSGSYQNRRHDKSGDSWGHLLLPTRAKPTEPVGSVTAIHPSAIAADAWSTAAYLGAKTPEDVRIIRLQKI